MYALVPIISKILIPFKRSSFREYIRKLPVARQSISIGITSFERETWFLYLVIESPFEFSHWTTAFALRLVTLCWALLSSVKSKSMTQYLKYVALNYTPLDIVAVIAPLMHFSLLSAYILMNYNFRLFCYRAIWSNILCNIMLRFVPIYYYSFFCDILDYFLLFYFIFAYK